MSAIKNIKNMSLFIPHVFPNFSQQYVAKAFTEFGDVDWVDLVAKQDRNGKKFNAVYIHFKKWYSIELTAKTQDDINQNGSIKFYHDDSEFYWIVLPNTAKKHVPGERKPRIDIGESKSISVKTTSKTPEKEVKQALVCPSAPKKTTYATDKFTPSEFEECLELFRDPIEEWDVEASEELAQMAEIDTELEAYDANLVSIDWRYVHAVEQEHMWLHAEVAQLRTALINLDQMYQAEAAKVRVFNA
jgi:hypothetical protein